VLDVSGLRVDFSSYATGLKKRELCAIRSLDLSVAGGEVLAVVGQSGAGKSLLAHALLGVLPGNARVSGTICFKERRLTPADMKRLRGREIALIPQSVSYLNPLLRVGRQVARAAELSGIATDSAWRTSIDALQRYRLDETVSRRFPFQLSGGMARRVLTATATVGGADLILADEPTNGLDQERALETLGHLRQLADAGRAVLLITHDIKAALTVADRVTVFCGGVTVEEALAGDFNGSGRLRHPYSRALWAALPNRRFLEALPMPAAVSRNGGCPFVDRCSERAAPCAAMLPDLRPVDGGRVRCCHA
jgi:peptide/nickel transport system ATP-binding protein